MISLARTVVVVSAAVSLLIAVVSAGAGATPPEPRSNLQCGGIGASTPSLRRGLECRLTPGATFAGKITAVEPGALRLYSPNGQFNVTTRITLADDQTVRIESTYDLVGGQTYELIVDPTKIRHSAAEPQVTNGYFDARARTFHFCFKPDEDAAKRRQRADHGCLKDVRIR
jgi:hypothetical protein